MLNYWRIPKVFKNQTVAILGGGSSLPHILQGRPILGCPVIGVNDAFRLGSWVDVCFFGDSRWYWWNKKDLEQFTNIKITCDRRSPKEIPQSMTIRAAKDSSVGIIQHNNGKGLCKEPNTVSFNSSSGACAINLAYHFGAKKVVLVGFDMRNINGETNWYHHPLPKTDKPYTNFITPFHRIAVDAKHVGLEIVNATPDSAIDEFPYVNFEEIYESLNRVGNSKKD